ncbi:MAG: GAF and ANTAR domain-containing protein [Ilumatobacteraceae bacterium]|nr:GAF and ANTAR domain-containing protein [Ilumatobacteraceae bacterium]
MESVAPLFDLLRRFAATMTRQFDVSDVLYELGDGAMAILDAAGAGVSVVNDVGELVFITSTSQFLVDIEHVQTEHQAGPCVEAFRRGETVPISDIEQLDQWPHYREAARRSGLSSVVGLPLVLDDHHIGSLNVYDTKIRTWTEGEMASASVLADVATAYLVHAGELAKARELTEQLQYALDSRIVIEQAKGMLSRDHSISVDAAFRVLRKYARSNNLGLRDVAHGVVDSGLTIPIPEGGP